MKTSKKVIIFSSFFATIGLIGSASVLLSSCGQTTNVETPPENTPITPDVPSIPNNGNTNNGNNNSNSNNDNNQNNNIENKIENLLYLWQFWKIIFVYNFI